MVRTARVVTAAVVLGVVALPAAAQPAPAGEPERPLLSGPTVEEAPARRTLVQRDLSGKIVRLEVPPAEAAVKLLVLDDATRAKVDAVLLERARLMDALVTENLELLVRLQGAREGNDADGARRLLRELREKSAPLRERGALMEELARVLTPEQAEEVRALSQEYVGALVEEEVAARRATGGGDGGAEEGAMEGEREERRLRRGRRGGAGRGEAAEVRRGLALAMAGAEVRRAYDRTIGAAARDFDQLLKDLNVTPEQESTIRRVVGDSFQKNYGKTPPRERARVFAEVWGVLDEGQREELRRRLDLRRGDPVAERPR